MKFQKMIRVPMMLTGLGVGLLLANPAQAQQDVDPDHFDATWDSSSPNQAMAQAAPSIPAAPALTAEAGAPAVAQEAVEAQLNTADTAVTLTLMFAVGSVILLGIAEAIIGSRRRTWKVRRVNGFQAGATAN